MQQARVIDVDDDFDDEDNDEEEKKRLLDSTTALHVALPAGVPKHRPGAPRLPSSSSSSLTETRTRRVGSRTNRPVMRSEEAIIPLSVSSVALAQVQYSPFVTSSVSASGVGMGVRDEEEDAAGGMTDSVVVPKPDLSHAWRGLRRTQVVPDVHGYDSDEDEIHRGKCCVTVTSTWKWIVSLLAIVGTIVVLTVFLQSTGAPYDFLMLQLTWPSGYCLSMADASCSRYLNQSMNNFTIHGFYPNYFANQEKYGPSFCDGDIFEISMIQSMISTLNSVWPSFSVLSNQDLWSHEWTKYGTCTGLSLLEYFDVAVGLFHQISAEKWLAKAGIVPSISHSYKLSEYVNAFRIFKTIRTNVLLGCAVDSHGRRFLTQIRLCVSMQELKFQYCDDKYFRNDIQQSNCGLVGNSTIFYWPFSVVYSS